MLWTNLGLEAGCDERREALRRLKLMRIFKVASRAACFCCACILTLRRVVDPSAPRRTSTHSSSSMRTTYVACSARRIR
eukprot:scaffold1282_cov105-Isochrysis_galbana.AAC.6